jgi:MFS transporter, MCT family, solute carrier family 16 (monocarboxylic acid transporters), member 10
MLMTFGAIFTYYANHLLAHVSTMRLCLIGSIPPFLALSCSIVWGRLLDSGYHLPINAIGGAFSTAGLVGLMFTGGNGTYGSGSYTGVLLSTFPIGLGQSCYFVTFGHVAKTWFPHCKGLAIGMGASGAAVGKEQIPPPSLHI